MNILKNIPFTYHWILKRAIGSGNRTVLDLGCGEGDLMEGISSGENWRITGVELYQEAWEESIRKGIYKKVVRSSITDLPGTVLGNKFDIVFLSQVIEHLKKKDGETALKIWEGLAKKRIIISTPVGFIKFSPIEAIEVDNPLQKHLSGWSPSEFTKRGYVVRGQGVRFIYGVTGLARRFPTLLPFWSFVAFLFAPIVYFMPQFGLYMIAWKDLK